jgi:hypothetical protein
LFVLRDAARKGSSTAPISEEIKITNATFSSPSPTVLNNGSHKGIRFPTFHQPMTGT